MQTRDAVLEHAQRICRVPLSALVCRALDDEEVLQELMFSWLQEQLSGICESEGCKLMLPEEVQPALVLGACARLVPPWYEAPCPILEMIDDWMTASKAIPMVVFGESGIGKVRATNGSCCVCNACCEHTGCCNRPVLVPCEERENGSCKHLNCLVPEHDT